MSVGVINVILDALAACVRTMFQVGLGLVQWNLDAAKARRRERERRRAGSAVARAVIPGIAVVGVVLFVTLWACDHFRHLPSASAEIAPIAS